MLAVPAILPSKSCSTALFHDINRSEPPRVTMLSSEYKTSLLPLITDENAIFAFFLLLSGMNRSNQFLPRSLSDLDLFGPKSMILGVWFALKINYNRLQG